jgi:hypothetical protein
MHAEACALSQTGDDEECDQGPSRTMAMTQNALSFIFGTVAPLAIVLWLIFQ